MSSLLELRPNRDLLDANFSGYKLSLDSIPVYRHNLETGADHVLPSDDQYSFLHIKIFGLHNHLYGDPWSTDDVYFIDKKWKIQKNVRSLNSGVLEGVVEVWEMPSNHVRKSGHYNTSLSFPSPELAVVADGAGTLHVVKTGSREETSTWKVLFSDEVCGKEKSFIVLDSRLNVINCRQEVHILLLWIDEERSQLGDGDEHATFVTKIEWITLAEGETRDWSMQSIRQLSGACGLDYAALEPGCESVYISSGKPFQFISDSENPIVQKGEPEEIKAKEPEYMWLQTADDITLWFQLAEGISKGDVNVSVLKNALKIQCKDVVLLEGPTFHCLESDLSTWSLEKGKLEITMMKAEQGLIWQELITNDSKGEQVPDPALVEEVHQRLAHLCSDKEVTDPSANCPPAFNSQQLEECDALPLETTLFVRLEANSHQVTHQINLGGNQWLFNASLNADAVPAICLRHDVDGCLWQMDKPGKDGDWPRTHVATFLAFGYVQASKQQKKFCTCSPDTSYVIICEASRHIYVYRQPASISSELRNRRTGLQVAHIAKQQLLNLETTEEILGIHASNQILYVLTSNTLLALRVNCIPGQES